MDKIAGGLKNMFAQPEPDENQEVTHQSGVSRLMNSILCALCCAPCLLLVAIILWGWNEKRSVCHARAIDQGKGLVQTVDCNDANAGSGKLVMFSCNVDTVATYSDFTLDGDFNNAKFHGAGVRTSVEMYQCLESTSSSTTTDKTGGGGQTTVTTYTYSMGWSSVHQVPKKPDANVQQEMLDKCGLKSATPNPNFPSSGPPKAGSLSSTKPMKVGAFTFDSAVMTISTIPINKVWLPAAPTGWVQDGDYFTTTKYSTGVPTAAFNKGLGKIRVKFLVNAPGDVLVTALGLNTQGKLTPWKSKATWLCSGSTLQDGRIGAYTKDELFSSLQAENTGVTWVLRILGFCIAWFAFSRLAGPCEVLADCIPCVGPYLGDFIEAVACFVAYFPACACCMFICGIVWVAMRPAVGVPLMLISMCLFGGLLAYKLKKKKEKMNKKASDEGEGAEKVGNASSTE